MCHWIHSRSLVSGSSVNRRHDVAFKVHSSCRRTYLARPVANANLHNIQGTL
uniref:Uncharacterized protein n=1 Tax=Arundo donax TaxID=35708 RepID=A0A0A8ZJ83_ARUDO